MLTPTDIAEYGERHVERWLGENNFQCYHSQQRHAGATDLEARNPEMNLLVRVKAALAPQNATELSDGERHGICSRAMMLECDAWFAQVQIDVHGQLMGEIKWTKLN